MCDLAHVLLADKHGPDAVEAFLDAEPVAVNAETAELKGVLGLT